MKLLTSMFKAKAATANQPPVQSQNGKILANKSTKVLSDDDIECSICFDGFDLWNIFKIPRIISCGHSFCSECLANLVQVDRSLKCPRCNFKIQNVTIEIIPRNYHLMEKLESAQKPAGNETQICQTCESVYHAATHRCVNCEEFTCSAMVKIRKEKPFPGASPLKEANWPLHVGKQLEVYDSTCRKAICSICALSSEHSGGLIQLKHYPLISCSLLYFPLLTSPLLLPHSSLFSSPVLYSPLLISF